MTVLLCRDIDLQDLRTLLERYRMIVNCVAPDDPIPGSFWQPPEAGLNGRGLYVRDDTPMHSALHEACHYICMDHSRRENLDTDAGGDYAEENGVCYLQVLLADHLPGMGKDRMFSDMDAWGYSFRLGSTRAWFERDAEDARAWLQRYQLIDNDNAPTWQLR